MSSWYNIHNRSIQSFENSNCSLKDEDDNDDDC